MALVKCRECGQQLSDRALKCPHCGAPAAAPTRALVGAGLAGLLVAAVLAGLMAVRGSGGEGGDPATSWALATGVGAVVVGLAIVLLLVKLRSRSG